MEIFEIETEITVQEFQRRPQTNEKVKVYLPNEKTAYGYINGMGIETESVFNYKTRQTEIKRFEIVYVRKTNEVFPLADCKYCLPLNRVVFL